MRRGLDTWSDKGFLLISERPRGAGESLMNVAGKKNGVE